MWSARPFGRRRLASFVGLDVTADAVAIADFAEDKARWRWWWRLVAGGTDHRPMPAPSALSVPVLTFQ